ncbi:T6SS effector phospholipase Tle3 domain-containing protein [Telluria beijingensis]|uniref:T6SS effector phospholipase Tle3 domain-containing protein n=1 Tax=Telluria beijingensis TaxID=3068633 RepID=UPI0027956483|nr:DUF3274 domain-containing protein [Massilia sp. REN29]
MSGKNYPKPEYTLKRTSAVLQPGRTRDKVIEVPREQPCNIIVVHGVNDVGTGYCEVEEGLCAGLQDRLLRRFKPAAYKMPGADDKKVALEDPDAVFFKRSVATDTDSPVIPFYWGYREIKDASKTVNGQKTDRNGNRLDKDLSKGGGPFGNATSSLPDMWNRGVYAPHDPVGDPLRPVKTGPGRMYMVLAARRLAALVTMIRQYEPEDTVNIVAHSQGCLLSLLAQALLMEMGERTADTLVLTHPPYSLDEEMGLLMKGLTHFQGDKDQAMNDFYALIEGRQSIDARLQTLINIVSGVAKCKASEPVFGRISEGDSGGMVHGHWKPDGDRDNRGKVYLYFCPEDMTVALDNMRGIGWQGVPDSVTDTRQRTTAMAGVMASKASHGAPSALLHATRNALGDLGPMFGQRVFTAKHRTAPGAGTPGPVLVGRPPHDFTLRLRGEDDHAHVAASGRDMRESLPMVRTPGIQGNASGAERYGIRRINGEALKTPFQADLRGGQIDGDKIPASSRQGGLKPEEWGPCDEVDPIDAAIAITSGAGLQVRREVLPASMSEAASSRRIGPVVGDDLKKLEDAYNRLKKVDANKPDDMYRILAGRRHNDQSVVADVQESPNAARVRWQHEYSPKSFHSAIFASRKNHRHVTAYDLSIGSGKAVSDPLFRDYLCAVADWRLQILNSETRPRSGILTWNAFLSLFSSYYANEPDWRKQLIHGNARYYSEGVLPSGLPLLTGKLWDIVISETTSGKRVSATVVKGKS